MIISRVRSSTINPNGKVRGLRPNILPLRMLPGRESGRGRGSK